jgi:hypothetical protein
MATNITPRHQHVFSALRDCRYGNFALMSCFLGGQAVAAIVTVNSVGEDTIITPVFVSVTPDMVLTDHDGVPANLPITPQSGGNSAPQIR